MGSGSHRAGHYDCGGGGTTSLGDYELLKKLGQGGMGTVYKARHRKLNRIVALKVLPKDRLRNAESVARFEREMEAVGRLDHPHIIRATDARQVDGIHKVIWDRLHDEPFSLPPDKPLTVVAYAAGPETSSYVEPVAVGDVVPEMPVFLTADRYAPCPLAAAYQIAWEQFPGPLKEPLESPPTV